MLFKLQKVNEDRYRETNLHHYKQRWPKITLCRPSLE